MEIYDSNQLIEQYQSNPDQIQRPGSQGTLTTNQSTFVAPPVIKPLSDLTISNYLEQLHPELKAALKSNYQKILSQFDTVMVFILTVIVQDQEFRGKIKLKLAEEDPVYSKLPDHFKHEAQNQKLAELQVGFLNEVFKDFQETIQQNNSYYANNLCQSLEIHNKQPFVNEVQLLSFLKELQENDQISGEVAQEFARLEVDSQLSQEFEVLQLVNDNDDNSIDEQNEQDLYVRKLYNQKIVEIISQKNENQPNCIDTLFDQQNKQFDSEIDQKLNEQREQNKELQEKLAQLQDTLVDQTKASEGKIEFYQEQLKTTQERLAKEREIKRTPVNQILNYEDKYNKLKSQYDEQSLKYSTMGKDLLKFKRESRKMTTELEELRTQMKQQTSLLNNTFIKEQEQCDQSLNQQNQQIDDLKGKIKQLVKEKQDLENKACEYIRFNQELTAKNKRLKQEKIDLSNEKDARIEKINDELLQVKIQRGKLETEVRFKNSEKQNHNVDIDIIKEDFENQIADLENELFQVKKDHEATQIKSQEYQDKLSKSESLINAYKKDMQEYKILKEDHQLLKVQSNKYKEEALKIDILRKQKLELQKTIQDLRSEIQHKETEFFELKNDINRKDKEFSIKLDEIDNLKNQIQEFEEKLKKADEIQEELNTKDQIMRENEDEFAQFEKDVNQNYQQYEDTIRRHQWDIKTLQRKNEFYKKDLEKLKGEQTQLQTDYQQLNDKLHNQIVINQELNRQVEHTQDYDSLKQAYATLQKQQELNKKSFDSINQSEQSIHQQNTAQTNYQQLQNTPQAQYLKYGTQQRQSQTPSKNQYNANDQQLKYPLPLQTTDPSQVNKDYQEKMEGYTRAQYQQQQLQQQIDQSRKRLEIDQRRKRQEIDELNQEQQKQSNRVNPAQLNNNYSSNVMQNISRSNQKGRNNNTETPRQKKLESTRQSQTSSIANYNSNQKNYLYPPEQQQHNSSQSSFPGKAQGQTKKDYVALNKEKVSKASKQQNLSTQKYEWKNKYSNYPK